MSEGCEAFEEAVRHMREAQKRYFKSRAPVDLDIARRAERLVDQRLAERGTATPPPQGDLF